MFRPVITPESFRTGSLAPIRKPKKIMTPGTVMGWSVIVIPKILVCWLITSHAPTAIDVATMPIPRISVIGLASAW